MTREGVIGKASHLPWNLPSDLERFKRITTGRAGETHAVIMGRITWESLPEKFRPLPGRINLVLSRMPGLILPGAQVHHSMNSALSSCYSQSITHAWVIGGRSVYGAAFKHLQVLHITWVEANVEGDVKFPEFDHSEWHAVTEMKCSLSGDDYPTTYVILERSS